METDLKIPQKKQQKPAKSSERSAFLDGALAGAFASMAVDGILYPVDTIKTRMQSAQNISLFSSFRGMYKGLGSALAASAPSGALFFGTYDASKAILCSVTPSSFHPVVHMVSGALAAAAGCVARTPFEVVKQGIQCHIYTGGRQAFRAILKAYGPRGLYSGYSSMLVREIPFDAIQLCVYEALKAMHVRSLGGQRQPSDAENSMIGASAGAAAGFLTCPADVIKTRLMTQKAGGTLKYTGIYHALSTILREEGVSTLFSGVLPRIALIACGGAIFFGVYEYSKKAIARSVDLAYEERKS